MLSKVTVEWLRLDNGSVQHACLPDWLHSVGSLGGPHRWTLCSRTGRANMEESSVRVGGRVFRTVPSQMKPCIACCKALAELMNRKGILDTVFEHLPRAFRKRRLADVKAKYGKRKPGTFIPQVAIPYVDYKLGDA